MTTERRSYKRYPVTGRILLHTQSMETPGELVDIGQWGAHIRTDASPSQGEELAARLEVQDYPGVFEVRGMVVRVQQDSWSMMFLEEPVGLTKLLRFLDEKTEEEIQEHREKEPKEKNLQHEAERDSSHVQREEPEARARRLEEDLAQAKQALQDQRETAIRLIRLLATERDQGRTQLSKAEAFAQKLQERLKQEKQEAKVRGQELATLRQTLRQEKKAAEALVHQLKAEQDEHRTQLSGFESHLQKLEEQLALAQKQFQDQRETVTRVIQQRAADREESQ